MINEELLNTIHLKVLEKIRPKKEERDKLEKEFTEMKEAILQVLRKNNIKVNIEVGGSFSRDTWLSGNRDIDIFVQLPAESAITPETIVNLLKKNIKLKWEKRHANHPYLYAVKDKLEIEIIPCYALGEGGRMRSPVDRSPLHKEFIKSKLSPGMNDEVRLLKQFMRGVETYGAEIKVHGFSGYLLELLIIHFNGQFLEVLRQALTLKDKIITFKENLLIDEGKFEGEPLVVIDPIDDNRNVASAVQEEALMEFIAAAEYYLQYPSLKFFFPEKIVMTDTRIGEIQNNDLYLTTIIHKRSEIAEDILWGQIRKFERSLNNYLEKEGFEPYKIDSFTFEKTIITSIITGRIIVEPFQWQEGPPIGNSNTNVFLEKYLNNEKVIHGPTLRNNKWSVLIKKDQIKIIDVIKEAITNNYIAIPSHIHLKSKILQILTKEQSIDYFKDNEQVLYFFYRMIFNKPSYL